MATSLTGTDPDSTYQSLLKMGDSAVVTSTLREISDGAGNAIPMQVSTLGVNFTGTVKKSGVDLITLADVPAASSTVSGLVELATNAETSTGSDSARAVTPAGLKYVTDSLLASLVTGSVSTAVDTIVTPTALFYFVESKLTVGAGAGTYTATATLATTYARTGSVCDLYLSLPASAQPTISVRNASSSGTELTSVTNTAPEATSNWWGRFVYTGTAWELRAEKQTNDWSNVITSTDARFACFYHSLTTLRAVVTAGVSVPRAVLLSTAAEGGGMWILDSGTAAHDPASGVIRPDDYSDPDNTKIYSRVI